MPLEYSPRKIFIGAGAVFLIIALLWPVGLSLEHALTRGSCFEITDDEALHLEVIENLAQRGVYSDWADHLLVPRLTTGPTVMLPAALLARVTGLPSSVAGRGIVFIWFVLIGLGLWFVFLPTTRALTRTLCLGLFFLGWRGIAETSYITFGVLGESAAVACMILAGAAYRREKLVLAGALAALCALSKPYFAFVPLTLVVTALADTRRTRLSRISGGCSLVLVITLALIVATVGTRDALSFVLNYPHVMRQVNGAGAPNDLSLTGLLSLWSDHLRALIQLVHWRTLGLIALGWGYFARTSTREPIHKWLLLLGMSALAWWVLLSPGAQARYLLPFAVAGLVTAVLAFERFCTNKQLHSDKRFCAHYALDVPRHRTLLVVTLIGLIAVFSFRVGKEWHQQFTHPDTCGLHRQIAIQEYIKQLPTDVPLRLTSLTQGYTSDLALTLVRPSLRITSTTPRTGLNVLGEGGISTAHQGLEQAQCELLFGVGTPTRGVWKCP